MLLLRSAEHYCEISMKEYRPILYGQCDNYRYHLSYGHGQYTTYRVSPMSLTYLLLVGLHHPTDDLNRRITTEILGESRNCV